MAVTSSKRGGKKGGRPRDFRLIAGMDPAANWLLGVALDDFLPDPELTMVPFLLELPDDAAVEAFNRLLPLGGGKGGNGALVLGFEPSNDRVRAGALLPVVASRMWFERLLDDDTPESSGFRDADKRIVLSTPIKPPDPLPKDFPDFPDMFDLPLEVGRPEAGWPDTTVVMAAIDDGFAFAHERFRNAAGRTRVLSFWDMRRLFPRANAPVRELTSAGIDALIAGATTGGRLDEDAVYAAAGQLDFSRPRHKPLAWRLSHGTHVLDLAAGYDPEDPVADRPIIAVQLPSPVVAQTTGELLDFYVWLGVLYARDRARRLAPGKPLVINTSFGYVAGAHDGEGLLDRFLDRIVANDGPRTRIVLPAGNSQLSRCHATIDFADRPTVEFEWIVQPDDRTHSVVEVWLPPAANPGNRMALSLTLPDGQVYRIDETPLASAVMSYHGKEMGLVELIERADGRRMFRIAIAPTARPQPHKGPLAPAGAWRLRFEAGPDPMDAPAHAWSQRDDSLYGYPQRGRQSYFDHPDYVRFDALGAELEDDPVGGAPCPVTRTSLLNAIASGEHVIVAGGYQTRDNRIAPYSSGGPNTPPEPPQRRKPDALLPSDGSRVHYGVLAAGARSGARLAQDGTSVASPALARRVADLLAAGSDATRSQIAGAAKSSPVSGPPAHPDRCGAGRLPRPDRLPVERFLAGD